MARIRSHKAPAVTRTGIEATGPEPEARRWTPATLIAFRFGLVYLGLFCVATQISGSMIPNLTFSYRGMGKLWPMRNVTHWTGATVFGVTSPLDDTAGGEPLFFWVQTFWLLILSVVAIAIWSVIDRRRHSYGSLHRWFYLFVRVALAASLFEYGMTKVIPTQFPAPPLATLVTPVGDLTLSALLWTSIGAAQPYEIFTGCIEVMAGVLLLFPRTTVLGAAIGLAALIQVTALNMFYDVGLKLVSLHMIALAVILLAPDLSRLADFFVRHRPAAASIPALPGRTPRAQRALFLAPILFGAYLLGMYAYINWSFWQVGGGGRPKSALYGIWNVEQLSVDGQLRPPELNDYDRRWRRVIFDTPESVVFQRTDDSFAPYGASLDTGRNVLTLRKGNSRNWGATFTLNRVSSDRVALSGEMDGHRIEAQLRRVEFEAFPLLNSSFRWIRPHER